MGNESTQVGRPTLSDQAARAHRQRAMVRRLRTAAENHDSSMHRASGDADAFGADSREAKAAAEAENKAKQQLDDAIEEARQLGISAKKVLEPWTAGVELSRDSDDPEIREAVEWIDRQKAAGLVRRHINQQRSGIMLSRSTDPINDPSATAASLKSQLASAQTALAARQGELELAESDPFGIYNIPSVRQRVNAAQATVDRLKRQLAAAGVKIDDRQIEPAPNYKDVAPVKTYPTPLMFSRDAGRNQVDDAKLAQDGKKLVDAYVQTELARQEVLNAQKPKKPSVDHLLAVPTMPTMR